MGSEKVLENFSRGSIESPGKVLDFFQCKNGTPECNPGETWGCCMQRKSCRYLLPFEHNAWTW